MISCAHVVDREDVVPRLRGRVCCRVDDAQVDAVGERLPAAQQQHTRVLGGGVPQGRAQPAALGGGHGAVVEAEVEQADRAVAAVADLPVAAGRRLDARGRRRGGRRGRSWRAACGPGPRRRGSAADRSRRRRRRCGRGRRRGDGATTVPGAAGPPSTRPRWASKTATGTPQSCVCTPGAPSAARIRRRTCRWGRTRRSRGRHWRAAGRAVPRRRPGCSPAVRARNPGRRPWPPPRGSAPPRRR